jgi:putative spermidine/putrescine transport system permease protein
MSGHSGCRSRAGAGEPAAGSSKLSPNASSAPATSAPRTAGSVTKQIVVTTFTSSPDVQTLPLWIFGNLFRPNQAPVVNVVAAVLILVAVVPVWPAQRLTDDAAGSRF